MDVETTRMHYKPTAVRILFIGESAPAKGGFFYFGGCSFTIHTRSAFEEVLCRQFSSDEEFLSKFRDLGCWLDDISHTPVNHFDHRNREAAIRARVPEFSARLSTIAPEVVIAMLRRIKRHVEAAVRDAGINSEIKCLPFPGFGHQRKFIEALVPILRAKLTVKESISQMVI